MLAARQGGRPGGPRALAAPLLVALAAALPYLGTLGHGFALDDSVEIVWNEQVRSLANLPALFTRSTWAGAGKDDPVYTPLTSATYALNRALGGPQPRGFHLVNVLLHAVTSLLVLVLARRIGMGPIAAAASAVLFALHPIHVEAVAHVAGRSDLLATLLVLATVLLHARVLRAAHPGPALALPVLAFAAALLAKESGAAALPLALGFTLVLDREPWTGARGRVLALAAAYLGTFGLYLLARWNAVGTLALTLRRIPYLENPLAHEDLATRLPTAVAVLGKGLWVLVFPRWLSPDWSHDAIPLVRSALDPRFLASFAVIAALLAGAWLVRRVWPGLTYLTLWYAAGALLTSNLLVPAGTIFGERLLYLPSVAFCIAGVWIVQIAAQQVEPPGTLGVGRLVPAVGVAFLAVFAARTVLYASAWSDEVRLLEEAVRAAPGSARARQLLGAALLEIGDTAGGTAALEEGVRRMAGVPSPDPGPRIQLGIAYELGGRLADAERVYGEILVTRPDEPDALWRLGAVRWRQDRRGEAGALWRQVLKVSPGHARAMTDLGLLLSSRGDAAGALALWRRAAEADPLAAGPWLFLGNAAAARGDTGAARTAWKRFLELARHGEYPGQREVVERMLREGEGRQPR